MKFHIYINQLQLMNLAPKAKALHAIVLDFLFTMCNSDNEVIEEKRVTQNGNRYTWVSYSHIIRQLPVLGGRTKATLTPVIKKLEEWGFIETAIMYGPGRKYIRLLDKTYKLFPNRPKKFDEWE